MPSSFVSRMCTLHYYNGCGPSLQLRPCGPLDPRRRRVENRASCERLRNRKRSSTPGQPLAVSHFFHSPLTPHPSLHAPTQQSSRRGRPVWPFRRPLRARDAAPRAGRAGGRIRQSLPRRRLPGRARFALSRLRRPAVAPVLRAAADADWPAALSIYLKREDLNHTGAHKINNTLGQALLTRRMGKTARDCRNRRRPARRRHGHGLCPLRPGLRGLHGRGRHPPAAAQRLQHEAAGGRGAAGHQRFAHAAGRHQRGAARLDELASRRRTTSSARWSVRIRSRGSCAIFNR